MPGQPNKGAWKNNPDNYRTCERCEGAGCSYCGHTGQLAKTRAAPFPVKSGIKTKLDSIPDHFTVSVPADITPQALADQVAEFADVMRGLYEQVIATQLLAATKVVDYHSKTLAMLDNAAYQIREGKVKPADVRKRDLPDMLSKHRHNLSGVLTHLNFVAENVRDLPLVEDGKIAYWAAKKESMPMLFRTAARQALEVAALLTAAQLEEESEDSMVSGYARAVRGD